MVIGEKCYDCIVVGAGISGIDAAYHLQKHCPDQTFVVLENRASLGGTWDFFNCKWINHPHSIIFVYI